MLFVTVVDWIYHDTVIYINSLWIIYSAAIVHTLLMPGEELKFEFAMFYSMALNAGVTIISVSLIFSGGLRLISLIKNSEAYGLQLLGLEQEAIVKIRLMTIGTLAIFQIISFGFLGALPGMLSTFHGQENKSLIKDIEGNKYTSLILFNSNTSIVIECGNKILFIQN